MSLETVALRLSDLPAPAGVTRFLADAGARVEVFIAAHRDRVPGFLPSDYDLIYRALRAIRTGGLATGDRLCEWGSGLGVVACLGAMLGFEACGIEIDAELTRLSRRLADDHAVRATFVRGCFVPESLQHLTDELETPWIEPGGRSGYDELGAEPDDFDVVYTYPWPGEERVVMRIFNRIAADGALLLTYRGLEGVRLHRKTHRASRSRARPDPCED